ncbi:MAG: hypothetical protein JWQ48_849 [Conexibacter sp.]|jgi:hypothetical protein|nr:hypothetical protein [Conexibacter sp.]
MRLHQQSIRILSLIMIVIGVVLIVRTLIAGGGGLAIGVVLGVLFIAAGSARIYLQTKRR